MANLRAPLVTSTTAIVSPDAGVNVEECIAIEKSGDLSILFIFDYDHTERNVLWTYGSTGDRDTELALLEVDSANFKLGNDAAFVSSTQTLITDRTGAAVTSFPALNLNKVVSISKVDSVTYLGTGSTDIYQLVFVYKAIDGLKEITWSYAVSGDRNTTFTELTAQAAALQYIP